MGNILFGKPLPRPISLEERGLYTPPPGAWKLSDETLAEIEALERSHARTMQMLRSGELDRMMRGA